MIKDIGGHGISPLGLGTYGIGGMNSADRSHDSEHVEAIKFALKNGITFIDTAEMYSAGHSEELVGRAISDFPREDVYITTKVWHTHLGHDDVLKSAKASLSRLNSGYIDLFLIHWPNRSVEISETVRAMEKLVDDGLVKNIGVSNFDSNELRNAMESTSRYSIVANQIPYSVINRKAEKDIIPYCEENNVAVIAYSPLNQGNLKRGKAVNEVAGRLGRSPVSVALNYLMKRSVPIPKSTNRDHIMDFVEAMTFELSEDDYRSIAEK